MTRRVLLPLVALLLLAVPAVNGQSLALLPAPESQVAVDGTSNRSEWSVEAQELSGQVTLTLDGEALTVSAAEVHVPAMKMKSTRGVIMDRLMRGALKANEHSDISFVTSAPVTALAAGEGQWTLTAPGQLTIAGATHDIEMTLTAEQMPDGRWKFVGEHPVKMSDYGMKPPTAMFGALVTGDEVLVRFDVVAAGA